MKLEINALDVPSPKCNQRKCEMRNDRQLVKISKYISRCPYRPSVPLLYLSMLSLSLCVCLCVGDKIIRIEVTCKGRKYQNTTTDTHTDTPNRKKARLVSAGGGWALGRGR